MTGSAAAGGTRSTIRGPEIPSAFRSSVKVLARKTSLYRFELLSSTGPQSNDFFTYAWIQKSHVERTKIEIEQDHLLTLLTDKEERIRKEGHIFTLKVV